MSSNICFLLLILFILIILYITVRTTKKPIKNNIQENFSQEEKEQLIDISNIKQSSLDDLMLITKLDVIKKNSHPRFPDKHLLVEGTNLEKVTDVYFGDLKGIILTREEAGEKTFIRVIPPNFSKFTKMKEQSEFENIEIKLKIDDPVDQTQRPVLFSEEPQTDSVEFTSDVSYAVPDQIEARNRGTLVIVDPKETDLDRTKKVKLSFKIEFEKEVNSKLNIEPLKIKFNDSEYKLSLDFINSIGKDAPEKLEEFVVYLNAKDLSKINFNIDTNKIFEKNSIGEESNLKKLKISNLKLEYLYDDINVLLPTGLFYRFDYTTTGDNLLEMNPDSWNVFLGERLDNPDIIVAEDVKKFYQDIRDLTFPSPAIQEKIILKVSDVKLSKVEGDDTILRMTWKTPPAINNFRFAFLINVIPKDTTDKFNISDEQVSFEKETFEFPTNKLTPGNEYTFQVSTYRTDKREVVDNSDEGTFRYVPPNFDEYHSHLFDPVTKRFKTELTQKKPELIKTYYQLLAANKIKMLNQMNNAESHIKSEAQCMEGNLNQLMNNASNDAFDDNIKDQLSKKADAEKTIFDGKQNEQNETIDRVKEKISELEKLQGKIKKVQNTNIKRLTSQKDGTDLAVKKLSNGKFMVGLNRGCLAVNKVGDYSNIPCNIFDKRQYFDLENVENDDEYNNLLLMNLNSKLSTEQKVDYPFSILKPNKSTKCVHINDKKIQIKPCNDDESIRYTSHFYQNDKCDSE